MTVGVPNELFLPALVKGLFRMTRRYGAYDARPKNVLKAALGRSPKDRPVGRVGPRLPYYTCHTGFDHRETRNLLSESFEPVRTFGSPVDALPDVLASEVYLILRKPYKKPQPIANAH